MSSSGENLTLDQVIKMQRQRKTSVRGQKAGTFRGRGRGRGLGRGGRISTYRGNLRGGSTGGIQRFRQRLALNLIRRARQLSQQATRLSLAAAAAGRGRGTFRSRGTTVGRLTSRRGLGGGFTRTALRGGGLRGRRISNSTRGIQSRVRTRGSYGSGLSAEMQSRLGWRKNQRDQLVAQRRGLQQDGIVSPSKRRSNVGFGTLRSDEILRQELRQERMLRIAERQLMQTSAASRLSSGRRGRGRFTWRSGGRTPRGRRQVAAVAVDEDDAGYSGAPVRAARGRRLGGADVRNDFSHGQTGKTLNERFSANTTSYSGSRQGARGSRRGRGRFQRGRAYY